VACYIIVLHFQPLYYNRQQQNTPIALQQHYNHADRPNYK